MCPSEREDGLGVIVGELRPFRWQVAGTAILDELASMDIGFNMTLSAEPWDPRPLSIDMTRLAVHVQVGADQIVPRKRMLKNRFFPGIRRVTIAALGRDRRRMDVVIDMASSTLTWSSLQHVEVLRPGMAAAALEKRMFPLESKGRSAMVKRGAIRI